MLHPRGIAEEDGAAEDAGAGPTQILCEQVQPGPRLAQSALVEQPRKFELVLLPTGAAEVRAANATIAKEVMVV